MDEDKRTETRLGKLCIDIACLAGDVKDIRANLGRVRNGCKNLSEQARSFVGQAAQQEIASQLLREVARTLVEFPQEMRSVLGEGFFVEKVVVAPGRKVRVGKKQENNEEPGKEEGEEIDASFDIIDDEDVNPFSDEIVSPGIGGP